MYQQNHTWKNIPVPQRTDSKTDVQHLLLNAVPNEALLAEEAEKSEVEKADIKEVITK